MIWLVMKPRDNIDSSLEDYPEIRDFDVDHDENHPAEADDELKFKLNIHEVGPLDIKVLTNSR